MFGLTTCEMMPGVTQRLEKAARAHREAVEAEETAKKALDAAKAERTAAGEMVAKTRGPLAEAIVDAARGGMRQVDIVRISGYNRERVRQICRAAGLEPGE